MRSLPVISNVRFKAARRLDSNAGLLGWVIFELDGLVEVDCSSVRLTNSGQFAIAFPTRRDREDRQHAVIAPMSGTIRRSIEQQVLAALREQGVLP